jgi:hypothetical protein
MLILIEKVAQLPIMLKPVFQSKQTPHQPLKSVAMVEGNEPTRLCNSLFFIPGPKKLLCFKTPAHPCKDYDPDDDNSNSHDRCKDVKAVIVEDLTHDASSRNLKIQMRIHFRQFEGGCLQERYWGRQKTTRSSERAYGGLT